MLRWTETTRTKHTERNPMTDSPTLFQKITPTEAAFHTAAQAAEVVNALSPYETTIQGTPGGGAVLTCLEAGETEVLEFTINADGTLTSHRMAEIHADGTVGQYQDAEGTHLWNAIHESLGLPTAAEPRLEEV